MRKKKTIRRENAVRGRLISKTSVNDGRKGWVELTCKITSAMRVSLQIRRLETDEIQGHGRPMYIPRVGPMADANAHTAASMPIKVPRSFRGTRSATIMSVREPMPAAPTPCTATQTKQFDTSDGPDQNMGYSLRPAMSIGMSLAAPQMALPSAKRQREPSMHGRRPKTSARAPLRG